MNKDFWPIPFPFIAGVLWLSLWAITCDVVHAHVSPEWLRVIINAATFIAMAAIAIYLLFLKYIKEDDSPAADDASTVSNEAESTDNNA